MTMKEKILEAFQNLGFEMNGIEGIGYVFHFEDVNFLWVPNEDEEFFNICVPSFFEKKAIDEPTFYQLMDKFNSTLMYVKVNEENENMWMFYERYISGCDNLEDTIRHMILHLSRGLHFARETIEKASEGNEKEESDADIIEDIDKTQEE